LICSVNMLHNANGIRRLCELNLSKNCSVSCGSSVRS
jgi:hypothetical protein